MALTGSFFLVLLVLGTVAAFVAAVLLLPRVSSWRPWPVLGRALILLVLNLVVLLTAAVALNDQYVFFADWTDLRGALTGVHGGATSFAGGGAAQAARKSFRPVAPDVTSPALPSLPPGATKADRVLLYSLTGPLSGLSGRIVVTLPEGYTNPANAHRRYPVLETFHGYPSQPSQWIDSMDLGSYLDNAVAKHEMAPAITISPTLEFPPGVDTECVDGGGVNPKVETWVTHDVTNWVLHTFRAVPNRSAWATIGLSAGGWCAAMAAMLHPAQYAAAIVLGGYFTPEFTAEYKPFGSHSNRARHYDLIALAKSRPPPVALWIQTSHSDPVSYPSSAKLLAAARAPLAVQALVLKHAGHRISVWKDAIPPALIWLGKNVPGFGPS